ncbi:MAG: DNA internalization-related competence protein ComEC/Rec2, partial [Candidatus Cloacimonetes bacterium]|nr:DNA internalization-related competence protein ComEC/Rec2 [Candidatus Cloacimonadota bacterium]
IGIGSGNLKILHPDKDYYSNNENERSIVCRLDYLDQRFLFTGDIGAPSEEYLSEKYPHELACNYLKTPHHGSKGSSTEEFLRLAHPQEAWICTSANNRFGFPHKDTIQRYYRQQVRLRSTAEGSIRKKIDSHRENKKL